MNPGLGEPGTISEIVFSAYIFAKPTRLSLVGGLRNSDVVLISLLLGRAKEDSKPRQSRANIKIRLSNFLLLLNKKGIRIVLILSL